MTTARTRGIGRRPGRAGDAHNLGSAEERMRKPSQLVCLVTASFNNRKELT